MIKCDKGIVVLDGNGAELIFELVTLLVALPKEISNEDLEYEDFIRKSITKTAEEAKDVGPDHVIDLTELSKVFAKEHGGEQ